MDQRMMKADEALVRRQALREDRLERFERLVEIRLVEDRVLDLFSEGVIPGTTHTAQGQEAVCVGIAAVMRPTDTVACTYRGHGAALALGMTKESVLGEIMGRQIGCMGGLGGSMHLSDKSVGLLPTFAIVGAGIPVAVGAGLTAQVLGTDSVAAAVFGDGATNIGAFHEGLNLAAIWKLPVIFVCENNSYGEYSRIELTTPVRDLAVRAASYNMPMEIVDGQDVDAVEAAMTIAVKRAREGGGPSFIEAKTYRYAGHSRSDKATYRPPGELDIWLARDPIVLFGNKLMEEGVVTTQDIERIWTDQKALLDETIERVKASPTPTPRQMFERVTSGGRKT